MVGMVISYFLSDAMDDIDEQIGRQSRGWVKYQDYRATMVTLNDLLVACLLFLAGGTDWLCTCHGDEVLAHKITDITQDVSCRGTNN